LFGIKPWEMDRLTYPQFVQFRDYAKKRLDIE